LPREHKDRLTGLLSAKIGFLVLSAQFAKLTRADVFIVDLNSPHCSVLCGGLATAARRGGWW
jgi:hypothetical protein